jgi:hypothetical protein
MCVDNIFAGRERASEILNTIEPEDGEFLYGERNGGIGYCPFKYVKDGQEFVATVRTTNRNFVKIDPRMLATNIAAAEDREIEHVLIVVFNWLSSKTMFIVRNCESYIHHETNGWRYKVFRKDHLSTIARGGSNGDVQLL